MTYLKRILINIFRSKTRSLLTMCGISVGVFAVVLISSIGEAGSNEISVMMETMGINSVLIQSESSVINVTLVQDDIEALSRIEGVNDAMPLMASITQSVLLGQIQNAFAWGIDERAKAIISLSPKYGRLIHENDVRENARVCVIDEEIAIEAYGRGNIVGKKIKILLGGAYHEFEVVGVAQSGISSLQNALSNIMPRFVYVPYSTMQILSGRTTYDKIAVLVQEEKTDNNIIAEIQETLHKRRGIEYGIAVNNLLQQKNQLKEIMAMVTLVLSVIAGISLIVSGITVMTTMLVSVNERTREIGIKKSIGARNADILREFLIESIVLCLLGSTAGAFIGVFASVLGCIALGVTPVWSMGSVVISILISMILGAGFGVYPAMKAANLKPIEALR